MKVAFKIASCLLLWPASTIAQSPVPAGIAPIFNTSLGYSYANIAMTPSSRIGLKGLDASLTVDFAAHLGVRADLEYVRASNVFNSGKHSDVLSYLAGPVYYPSRYKGLATYVQALFGAARITGPVPAGTGGFINGYANKPSWALGGGMEYVISSSIGIRIGADYLHTDYFTSSAGLRGQSNIRAVGSIVYNFGAHKGKKPGK